MQPWLADQIQQKVNEYRAAPKTSQRPWALPHHQKAMTIPMTFKYLRSIYQTGGASIQTKSFISPADITYDLDTGKVTRPVETSNNNDPNTNINPDYPFQPQKVQIYKYFYENGSTKTEIKLNNSADIQPTPCVNNYNPKKSQGLSSLQINRVLVDLADAHHYNAIAMPSTHDNHVTTVTTTTNYVPSQIDRESAKHLRHQHHSLSGPPTSHLFDPPTKVPRDEKHLYKISLGRINKTKSSSSASASSSSQKFHGLPTTSKEKLSVAVAHPPPKSKGERKEFIIPKPSLPLKSVAIVVPNNTVAVASDTFDAPEPPSTIIPPQPDRAIVPDIQQPTIVIMPQPPVAVPVPVTPIIPIMCIKKEKCHHQHTKIDPDTGALVVSDEMLEYLNNELMTTNYDDEQMNAFLDSDATTLAEMNIDEPMVIDLE
jgi:hypothetical protein